MLTDETFSENLLRMVRHEHHQGSIRIAFGHDETSGYFISVYDTRLEVNEETGDDFEEICYDISASGTGAYLTAHTGTIGFGKRVSYDTMKKLWRSYEVGETGMELLAEKRGSL
jgi:hypothetical protein